jgi:23S rRNA (guanosine2251-2'-O)-methyltransferase
MPNDNFITRQCSNPHCRFRFPASSVQPIKPHCPKCGYLLSNIGSAYANALVQPAGSAEQSVTLSILLDNVRSAFNVGSIMRTCDGIGVEEIHLCGITATPDNPKVGKTALSAELNVPWFYHLNALDAVQDIKSKGFQIWTLEVSHYSNSIHHALTGRQADAILLVAGNEQAGVDPDIQSISDQRIHIPMSGSKNSFNIAVAVAIAATLILSPGWV